MPTTTPPPPRQQQSRFVGLVLLSAIPPAHLPTWEREWQGEMDKQLAHITFERQKEWNHLTWVPTLESEMRLAWAAFLKAVVDPAHKTAFASQLAICQAKPGFKSVRL